ncbi:hypothetical protein [Streptomyces sp. NBC_00893]|uniref:hypothetical protein n=1 Tax=Streptomyces sp. NBC_00893 TaxID=2975862 RepID=UPI002259195E|nr:hypothetical protein [Streptomyces sp. NBC_00893]MCX4849798.1 hypothetical protein [Streptomyces sp. NBC_00893]
MEEDPMPWVRLDDRFPSHRKVALLSDRAFRLHVTALCWCSENLTEGAIRERELPVISRIRGVKKAALELEEAGLWDRTADGWEVHDYLEYNPDRARVQADRDANAARQKAWRDRKRAEREAKRATEEGAARNAPRNGVTDSVHEAENDASATRRRHDDDTTEQDSGAENREEPQVNAFRNAVSNGTPSRPVLPSPMEKEEEGQLATRAGATELPRIGDRPRIPAAVQPLVSALQAARLFVGWDLTSAEWLLIEALIRRCGIPALVVSATGSWQGARTQPRSGRYFLPAWRSLPDAAAANEPVDLPVAAGGDVIQLGPPAHGSGPRRSTTDERVNQALEAGRRLQAIHDAQTQENQ